MPGPPPHPLGTVQRLWRGLVNGGLFSVYYGVHILIFAVYYCSRSYLAAGSFFSQRSLSAMGFSGEEAILAMIVFNCSMKSRYLPSWPSVWSQFFNSMKLGVLVIFCASKAWMLVFTWLMACLAIFLLVEQPEYSGPDKVISLISGISRTERSIETRILEAKKDQQHLVCFHANYHEACIHFLSIFRELSSRYATDQLHFAEIDVGRFQNIAKKYSIETRTMISRQLPTVILFKGGAEMKRLPSFQANKTILKTLMTGRAIFEHFDLEKLSGLKHKETPDEVNAASEAVKKTQ